MRARCCLHQALCEEEDVVQLASVLDASMNGLQDVFLSSMGHVNAFAYTRVVRESDHAQFAEEALNFVCFSVPKAQFLQWLPDVRRDEDVFEGPSLAHSECGVYAAILLLAARRECHNSSKLATFLHVLAHECH